MCRARSPCRWPISRRPTMKAKLAAARRCRPRRPGHEVTSSVICSPADLVCSSWRLSFEGLNAVRDPRLQVQVNLKSRADRGFLAGMSDLLTIGEVARRSGVAASALALLRGARPDHVRARRLRATAAIRRPVLRRIAFIVFAQRIGLTLERDRRGARQASARSRPQPPRLVAPVERLDVADRRADRRARAPQGRADRVHRLRLPLARPLPARQSRRPGGAARTGTALLGRGRAGLELRAIGGATGLPPPEIGCAP